MTSLELLIGFPKPTNAHGWFALWPLGWFCFTGWLSRSASWKKRQILHGLFLASLFQILSVPRLRPCWTSCHYQNRHALALAIPDIWVFPLFQQSSLSCDTLYYTSLLMVLEARILHCLCVHLHSHLFIHWFICPPWTGMPLQFNSATWEQEMDIILHLCCPSQDLVYRECLVNVCAVNEWSHTLHMISLPMENL